MLQKLIYIYVLFFGRKCFQKMNRLMHRLSLAGLGILNYKSTRISGEKFFLKTYLAKNDCHVVVDIGANKGDYVLELLNINPTLKIYAFEPHPTTFSCLFRNVSAHTNVNPINKGVSSNNGVLRLYDYPSKDGSQHASIYQEVITDLHGAGSAIYHEVESTTIDTFMELEPIEYIDLLKIDTEGNELEVLLGGINSIKGKRIKAIHFEFNEMNVISRVFFRDFWKILDGYRFYRLLPGGMLEIKNYNPLMCEIFAYQNIVAILKD